MTNVITKIENNTVEKVNGDAEVLVAQGAGYPAFWIEMSKTHRHVGSRFVKGHANPVNVWKMK